MTKVLRLSADIHFPGMSGFDVRGESHCRMQTDLTNKLPRLPAKLVLMAAFAFLAGVLPLAAQTASDVPVPPRRPVMEGGKDLALPATGSSLSEGRKAERDPELPVSTQDGCLERLIRAGVVTEKPGPTTNSDNISCEIAEAVILLSVADPHNPGHLVKFRDRPRLSCLMAERVVRFTTNMIAPLARGTYGKELVAVATGPGYECRPRNRQPGAKLSSHAQGNAVDVSGVELSGGRSITVQNPGDATSDRFVTGFREAACGFFNTVLGPGSDAAHHDHIHLDIEMRGRDGRSKFCQ